MISYLKRGKDTEARADITEQVRATVQSIIADIAARGDEAVRTYSERFDRWAPESFRLSDAQIAASMASLTEQETFDGPHSFWGKRGLPFLARHLRA